MSADRIRIGDDYYLLASALPPRGRRVVLNHGDTFAIISESGDVPLAGHEPFGLFCAGTRFLDRYELRLNGNFPIPLSATLSDDGSEQVTFLTNADEHRGNELVTQRDSVAVERRKVLIDGALFEDVSVRSYAVVPIVLRLSVIFTADFADLFELRGVTRRAWGERRQPEVDGTRVRLAYRGLDGVERTLELCFEPAEWQVGGELAELVLDLPPGGTAEAAIRATCRIGDGPPAARDGATALSVIRAERRATAAGFARLTTSSEALNGWIQASLRDLSLLCATRTEGSYPYAGIPWFATVFGRDGLVTAFETLAFAPSLTVGVLRTLAGLQGRAVDASRDEEPGRILHELRLGEMAATGEVPFGRYYGSIDATPLFVALLAAYAGRTGDMALVEELWPAAIAASEWMQQQVGARGYLSYQRRTPRGLANQGWKDSHDAISHADGRLAEPPIALCEVQGYLFAALDGMAMLAERRGAPASARRFAGQARMLRERFAGDFWLEDEGTYALAIDGEGRPCRVVASNAGHCLFSGIAMPTHAERIAARLVQSDCYCGWGIRTLSGDARRFNPMSYHNGSVWPHDNALIAAGLARYGFVSHAALVFSSLLAVSRGSEDQRLPELFCGFNRRPERPRPVRYPVACQPQAWAAGSVFLLLEAVLGLSIDGWSRRVTFAGARLPDWLDYVVVEGLSVGEGSVDVKVARAPSGAVIDVLDRRGGVDVRVTGG
jgi:glycogen debranching enzyme